MQVRAVGVTLVFLGIVLAPLAVAGGQGLGVAGLTCFDRMLQEMGWDQPLDAPLAAPEGTAFDPLPEGASVVPAGANDLHPCQGKIQPGARMTNGCTMNFIFRDQQGALYLGTAGHCTSGVGASIGISGVASGVATVVYDGYPGSLDFALARINPAYYSFVDSTMCHWGGPEGINSAPAVGQTTHIYGFGNIYGASPLTRPRTGAMLVANTNEVTYLGFAQPGDSGSPLLTGDGDAVGVHVRSSLSLGGFRIDPSPKFATRIDASIAAASAATGLQLSLVEGLEPFNLLATA